MRREAITEKQGSAAYERPKQVVAADSPKKAGEKGPRSKGKTVE